jgi:hypothetical protein
VLLSIPWQISSGYANWGTVTLSNYVDSTTGYTRNGTLSLVYFASNLTTTYTEYDDFTGTASYRGRGLNGTVVFDFPAATNVASSARSAPVLSGTLSTSGLYYDGSTGNPVSVPTPTVSFSPASVAGSGTTLALSAPGADTTYYTTDGSMPTAASPVHTTNLAAGSLITAYAVKSGIPGRVSIAAYPSGVYCTPGPAVK